MEYWGFRPYRKWNKIDFKMQHYPWRSLSSPLCISIGQRWSCALKRNLWCFLASSSGWIPSDLGVFSVFLCLLSVVGWFWGLSSSGQILGWLFCAAPWGCFCVFWLAWCPVGNSVCFVELSLSHHVGSSSFEYIRFWYLSKKKKKKNFTKCSKLNLQRNHEVSF